MDFTDLGLTIFGGAGVLAQTARRFGLFELLKELVLRHRAKQGQENAFKGPLRDMDLHHPPCRSYRANQAFYALGQIAQALLRAVQFTVLPKRARRHGIRPVIRYVMRTAAGPRPAPGAGGLMHPSVRATLPRRGDALPRLAPTPDRNGGIGPLRSHPGRRPPPPGPANPPIRPSETAPTHSTPFTTGLSGD